MDPAKYCLIDAITLLYQLIKAEVSGVTKVEGSGLDIVFTVAVSGPIRKIF